MTGPRYTVLDQLRVIAMFLVLLVHSPVNEEFWTTPVVSFLQRFIAVGAVPAFFMLSGYLGARKLDSRSVSFRQYALERKIRAPAMFFVYATHALLFTVMGRLWQMTGKANYGSVGYFLAAPLIAFPLCVAAYWALRALFPRLVLLATGGR